MNHAFRRALYTKIEAARDTRMVAFVTGERNGLQTQIAGDAVDPWVKILDRIGPVKRLSLIINTSGGQTSAAWRLINLIRSFCDELEVIIPTKAMSAGTLMSLGADKIIMTKQAALGPIDPTLDNHPLSPTVKTATGQEVRIGISAEAVRGYVSEVKKRRYRPSSACERLDLSVDADLSGRSWRNLSSRRSNSRPRSQFNREPSYRQGHARQDNSASLFGFREP